MILALADTSSRETAQMPKALFLMSKTKPVGLLCHWHLALRHAIEVLALHSENSKVQAKAAASCLELCFLHKVLGNFGTASAIPGQFLI